MKTRRQMTVATWVRNHRASIDAIIQRSGGHARRLNDHERRLWVVNDEGLYCWARADGARV